MSHSRWTNIFYVIVGVFGAIVVPGTLSLVTLASCVYLAIGSYKYHTTLSFSDALHDERGMYLVVGSMWALLLYGAGMEELTAIVAGMSLPVLMCMWADEVVIDSHVTMPLMILAGTLLVLSLVGPVEAVISLFIFSVSAWIRTLKGKYEEVFHGLWHFGTSTGIAYIITIAL